MTRPELLAYARRILGRRVHKNPGDGCWLWTGTLSSKAQPEYSSRKFGSLLMRRLAYEIQRGVLSRHQSVARCPRSARCVRADHLKLRQPWRTAR